MTKDMIVTVLGLIAQCGYEYDVDVKLVTASGESVAHYYGPADEIGKAVKGAKVSDSAVFILEGIFA